MTLLVCNLLLALAWSATIGPFTIGNFIAGFVVGFAALTLGVGRAPGATGYHAQTWRVVKLLAYFLWQLLIANVQMVKYTLSPLSRLKPAILRVPLAEGMTDFEITTLANMITLTPGTLSLDVSADRRALFVHFMHTDDAEASVNDIKNGFERLILEATRGGRAPSPEGAVS